MPKVNVTVKTALMAKIATRAKKIITITHFASLVIVILLVSLPSLLDAVQFLLVNCVNVRNVFKEEFAINVDLSIGI